MGNTSLCIGVDGCKGGWITAVYDCGILRVEKYFSISEIMAAYPRFDEMLIDMVIGLPSDKSDIRPDTYARNLIKPRGYTIFPVPSRQAVYKDTENEQKAANIAALGKSLSRQTMAIIPKIRELDEFLDCHCEYKNAIKESHPEVCFARLNKSVVMTNKKMPDGLKQRVGILSGYLPELTLEYIFDMARKLKCGKDDIVDAVCLAVTADLCAQNKTQVIPDKVQEDAKGLRMQMVIPSKFS